MKEKNKKYTEDLNCTCTYCGKKFHKKKSHISIKNFCNIDCKKAYLKSQRVTKKCLTCGKEFDVNAYKKDTAKFCSVKCHDEYQRRFFIKTKCSYCGKEINVNSSVQSHNKTGKYFCSNICAGKYFRGERSPMYTGNSDVYKILRSYYAQYQRKLIFIRDNKTCQICGGVATNVHHIYPIYKIIDDFKVRHPEIDITKNCYHVALLIITESEKFKDLNNMIAVCECCHSIIHKEDRKDWGGRRNKCL